MALDLSPASLGHSAPKAAWELQTVVLNQGRRGCTHRGTAQHSQHRFMLHQCNDPRVPLGTGNLLNLLKGTTANPRNTSIILDLTASSSSLKMWLQQGLEIHLSSSSASLILWSLAVFGCNISVSWGMPAWFWSARHCGASPAATPSTAAQGQLLWFTSMDNWWIQKPRVPKPYNEKKRGGCFFSSCCHDLMGLNLVSF